MHGTLPRFGIATLFATLALSAGGCNLRNDAAVVGNLPGALAGVVETGAGQAPGTDLDVEDSELTVRVRGAILADPQLRTQQVHVETEDSAVTLTGSVDSQPLRERAAQLADSVAGVVQVRDRLEVRP